MAVVVMKWLRTEQNTLRQQVMRQLSMEQRLRPDMVQTHMALRLVTTKKAG